MSAAIECEECVGPASTKAVPVPRLVCLNAEFSMDWQSGQEELPTTSLPGSLKDWIISAGLFAVGYAVLYALMSIPQ